MHSLINHLFRQLSTLQLVAGPILLILPLLASCDRPIEILDIRCESELVVYAFPSTDDEYLLTVSLSRPTAGHAAVEGLNLTSVESTTNGRPDDVTLLHEETHYGMPMAIYRVKGEHHSGDKISISVKDANGRSASASTIIPVTTPMDVTRIDTVETASGGSQLRILEHFTPQTSAKEIAYYATRLTTVWDTGDDNDYNNGFYDPDNVFHENYMYTYSRVHYIDVPINPAFEPLLNRYNDLDLDAWNEYYAYMYFLSTDDILRSSQAEGLTHGGIDLHLNISSLWQQMDYLDVQFYTLSPEYYLMLRHINDQLSNELAEVGLSQTFSTYSNVRGGLGCVAAYTCSHYKYTPPVIESDGMLY